MNPPAGVEQWKQTTAVRSMHLSQHLKTSTWWVKKKNTSPLYSEKNWPLWLELWKCVCVCTNSICCYNPQVLMSSIGNVCMGPAWQCWDDVSIYTFAPQAWICSRRLWDAGRRRWPSGAGRWRTKTPVQPSKPEQEMPLQSTAWRWAQLKYIKMTKWWSFLLFFGLPKPFVIVCIASSLSQREKCFNKFEPTHYNQQCWQHWRTRTHRCHRVQIV